MIYIILQVMVISTLASPYIIILFPPMLILSFNLVKYTVRTLRETSRIQSITKSPLLSFLSESINGASTIRAFGRTDDFIKANNKLLNENIIAVIMNSGVNSWFSIRIDMIAVGMIGILTMTGIFSRAYVDPVMLSLMLQYSLQL